MTLRFAIWIINRKLFPQKIYKKYLSPPNCCIDKLKSIFIWKNEDTDSVNLLKAAKYLSKIVSNGFLELVQEVRVSYEANPLITESISFYHASWKHGKTWEEVSCVNLDDIVSYIKLLSLPSMSLKDTSTVLLSPWFLGNIFHEFAHSLEIDHAPHSLRRIGQKVFSDISQPFSIFENPSIDSFGKHSFSDAGTQQKKRCLVQNGTLLSCIGDYKTGENLYMGYADNSPLLARTVCLEVVGDSTEICPNEGIIVLGGDISTVLLRPCDTLLYVKEIYYGYFTGNVIVSYSKMVVNRIIRLNEILKKILFVSACNINLPAIGGFCKKNGAIIRSIQKVGFATMVDANILF